MNDQLTLHTVDAVEVRLPIAGAGSRAYAFIIDWHVRTLAAIVLAVPLMMLNGWMQEALPGVDAGVFLVLAWLLPLLVYLLYHPVLEVALRGRTPGKRFAGVRIVTLDGATPGAGPILVRNLFRIVDSLPLLYALGLAVVLTTRNSVRIGDLAAGTVVIHDGTEDQGGIAAAARLPASLPPHTHQLLAEWLARWSEIAVTGRDNLALRILERVPETHAAARELRGRALRDFVSKLVADVR
jgi:uncharacterized RDD family membrane protein YckC